MAGSSSPESCGTSFRQKLQDEIVPTLQQQFLSEQTLCTFVLQVCDTDRWQAIDLDQWVLDKINSKPKKLQANNFINDLYSRTPGKQTEGTIKVMMYSASQNPDLPSMLKFVKEDVKPDFVFLARELSRPDEALKEELGEIPIFDTLESNKLYYSKPLMSKNGAVSGGRSFKVISINSNYCNSEDWTQLTKYQDPGQMLDWLDRELA